MTILAMTAFLAGTIVGAIAIGAAAMLSYARMSQAEREERERDLAAAWAAVARPIDARTAPPMGERLGMASPEADALAALAAAVKLGEAAVLADILRQLGDDDDA